jgi:hypothetical protein
MHSTLRVLLLPFLFAALTIGCTQKREQYRDGDVTKPTGQQTSSEIPEGVSGKPTNPDGGKDIDDNGEAGETDEELSQDEIDRRVRENSQKPVSYGVSAGGVSFSTTFQDSKKILSRPVYGPDADGLAAYDEGIWVYWRKDEPRTPSAIFVNLGYQGEIFLGDTIGTVRIGDELNQFFSSDDQLGEEFIVELYNHFESKTDGYNCLVEQTCILDDSNDQFLLYDLPGMVVLVTKDDRKTLFRLVLQEYLTPGKLQNDFDVLNGQVLVTDASGNVVDRIQNGSLWKDVKEFAQPDENVKTSVFPRDFVNRYTNVAVGVSRSSYDEAYTTPNDKEVVTQLFFNGTFPATFRFGEKYVEFDNALGTVDVRLVKQKVAGKSYLKTQMKALAGKPVEQMELIKKLSVIAEQELKQAPAVQDTDTVTFKRLTGLNSDEESRTFALSMGYYNTRTEKGHQFEVSIDEALGTATYFSAIFNHPLDSRVIPTTVKPIEVGSPSLAGFTLGDTVFLKEKDEGREQVTFVLADQVTGADGQPQLVESVAVRSSYDPNSALRVAYLDNDKFKEFAQQHEEVGLNGVTLWLNKIGEMPVSGQTLEAYEVNAITSSANTVGIKDVCGIQGYTAPIGQYDIDFASQLEGKVKSLVGRKQAAKERLTFMKSEGKSTEEALAALTDREKFALEYQGCRYSAAFDDRQDGKLTSYFFPQSRMKVLFGDREVSGVTIYKKPGEQIEKGAQ